eukprot:Skav235713  [mRNA]  locus=scaffold280:501719:503472:+ [translate_table: standard]
MPVTMHQSEVALPDFHAGELLDLTTRMRTFLLLLLCCFHQSWTKVWYPGADDQIEGCYTVTTDLVDDHSSASCGGKQCPNCFELDTSSQAITLTITNCHYVNGVAMTGKAVFLYTFQNTGHELKWENFQSTSMDCL